MAAAGYEVIAVTACYDRTKAGIDAALARDGGWTHVPVWLDGGDGQLTWRHRMTRRVAGALAEWAPLPALGGPALVYGAGELGRKARELRGDLYIGQQHACVAVAGAVAASQGVAFGGDIEDILSECSDEPRRLIRSVEARHFGRAAFLLTMSEAAGDFLRERFGTRTEIVVVHNCPRLDERGGLVRPRQRRERDRRRVYWFGQTLGPHSCALELIEANAKAGGPFDLRFRGNARLDYVEAIRRAAAESGLEGSVECLPLADPRTMVEEAGDCDVLFGSQPSQELFHQLAIGNKVFTGVLAGCVGLLSDTIAHRRLAEGLGDCVELVDHRDAEAFGEVLVRMGRDREDLVRRQEAAWELGTSRYHWEAESELLIDAVGRALEGEERGRR